MSGVIYLTSLNTGRAFRFAGYAITPARAIKNRI